MVIVQIPHHYDLEVTFLKLLLLLNRVGCSGYKSVRCEKDNFSKIIGALWKEGIFGLAVDKKVFS